MYNATYFLLFTVVFWLLSACSPQQNNANPDTATQQASEADASAVVLQPFSIPSPLDNPSFSIEQEGKSPWLSYSSVHNSFVGQPSYAHIGMTTLSITNASSNTTLLIEVTDTTATDMGVMRLVQQATFGADTAALATLKAQGIYAWVEEQLHLGSAYDSTNDNWKTHFERTQEIAQQASPDFDWQQNGVFNQQIASRKVLNYQTGAWLDNALGSKKTGYADIGSDQLRQRVAYALSQLLVVSSAQPIFLRRGEALAAYYDILAKNAFGNYRTLLEEVAKSPAMGMFLSHQGNQKTSTLTSTVPDENFARELMQLFTIGLYELNIDASPNTDANANTFPDSSTHVVATFQPIDVSELAKVMTGWDLRGNSDYGKSGNKDGDYSQPMEFTVAMHEDESAIADGDGQVTLLGQTFALNSGDDQSGMDAALDILFQHSNVAPYVSKHLIQRLVTSNPSSSYVKRVSDVFNNNGDNVKGDLKAVVRAILFDDEARDYHNLPSYFGKVKEPLLAMLQLFKALNVQPLEGLKATEGGGHLSNVYWYPNPQTVLGQGPLRAASVFNFYSPDFIPSDAYFATNRLVSPESQLYTDQMLVGMSNSIHTLLNSYEKNRISIINNETLSDFGASKTAFDASLFVIVNFDEELAAMELAIDGDENGDFVNINETTARANGINALLTLVDKKLFGMTMDDDLKSSLRIFLTDAKAVNNNSDHFREAWNMVYETYRFVATSSLFLTQK